MIHERHRVKREKLIIKQLKMKPSTAIRRSSVVAHALLLLIQSIDTLEVKFQHFFIISPTSKYVERHFVLY